MDQVRLKSTPQNLSKFFLVPYIDRDGWTLTDDMIRHAFEESSQTIPIVFSEKVRSADQFLTYTKHPGNLFVFAFNDENNMVGYAWLNSICDNYAFAHFNMFPCIWGKSTKDLGVQILDYWRSFKMFDLLLGLVPTSNQKAINYVQKLNFQQVGIIPLLRRDGELKDAMLLYKRL